MLMPSDELFHSSASFNSVSKAQIHLRYDNNKILANLQTEVRKGSLLVVFSMIYLFV